MKLTSEMTCEELEDLSADPFAAYDAAVVQSRTACEVTVQEAARVLLGDIVAAEEHGAWSAAQDAYDAGLKPGAMGEASEVVIATIRAIAGGKDE